MVCGFTQLCYDSPVHGHYCQRISCFLDGPSLPLLCKAISLRRRMLLSVGHRFLSYCWRFCWYFSSICLHYAVYHTSSIPAHFAIFCTQQLYWALCMFLFLL